MHPKDKQRAAGLVLLLLPFAGWLIALKGIVKPDETDQRAVFSAILSTPHSVPLIGGLLAGLAVGILFIVAHKFANRSVFRGAEFHKHLRGTRLVTGDELARQCRDRKQRQVTIADIPAPLNVEPRHMLVNGSTGTGKSVLLTGLAFSAMLRQDRLIVCDPNGDLFSKFGRVGDRLLNPFDARTERWSLFNEIRNSYDYERYAESLIQSQSQDEEEWCGYARLLWREAARRVVVNGVDPGQTLMGRTFELCTMAPVDELAAHVAGTYAQSMFVDGADKALGSARFILSKNIGPHLKMPDGKFSIRDWLEDETAGNLFITWREDQAPALRPLISAWVDVLCTSILSLPENPKRKIWMLLDELGSLNKLPSLEAAATKGRKVGLRLVAGLQSVSQLTGIYGPHGSQTLRACFSSLIVLGGGSADEETAEVMSKAIGEHEVERRAYSANSGDRGGGESTQYKHDRERVVLPSELINLPPLEGFVKFAGNYPVARTTLVPQNFKVRNTAFVEAHV